MNDALNDCRAAFEEYYGAPLNDHNKNAFTMAQHTAWSAWQAAWNQRPSEISGDTEAAQKDRAVTEQAYKNGYQEGYNAGIFMPLGDNHHNAAKCPYCLPMREASEISEDCDDDLTPAVIANYRRLIKDSIAPDGRYGFFAGMADSLLDWIEKYGRKPKRKCSEISGKSDAALMIAFIRFMQDNTYVADLRGENIVEVCLTVEDMLEFIRDNFCSPRRESAK